MNVVELFSGIGSQVKALKKVSEAYGFDIDVVKTCEWDIHAVIAYDLIHNGNTLLEKTRLMSKEQLISDLLPRNLSSDGKTPISPRTITSMNHDLLSALHTAIERTANLINVSDVNDTELPDNVDLLTYSFPCQDLSNVGAFHGYTRGIDRNAKTRSGLLWEVERILNERRASGRRLPRYLLLENVAALNSKRHQANFKSWQDSLESLGYVNHLYMMQAQSFGIPQNRTRLLMLSVQSDGNAKQHAYLQSYLEGHDFTEKTLRFGHRDSELKDFLRLDYDNPILMEEAKSAQPNDTESRRKIWRDNLVVADKNGNITKRIGTLTTKQDRHPNSGNIYFQTGEGKSDYRFLTPRECFLLMGFDEKDFEKLKKSDLRLDRGTVFFSRDKMYRLTGNSIVVNVLEAVFEIVALLERDYFNRPRPS